MSRSSYLLEWDSAHTPHQSIDVDVVTGPALLAGPYMREMGRHHDARHRTFAGWQPGSGGPVQRRPYAIDDNSTTAGSATARRNGLCARARGGRSQRSSAA